MKISAFKICLFLMLINGYVISVCAQSGNIRGFVYEKETGEPVIFTGVSLKGTTFGAQTDVNGYFSITRVNAGSYTLQISYLGFDTLRENITIKDGQISSGKYYLTKSSIKLKELEITAEKQELKTEVRTSVTKITPKDIKKIPTVGGQPDLAQYLQVLPGVVFTGDQGGQLYIRGGAPVQNKMLLDGMIIYNPFHSIGLFSVFDADYIRNADVYTGGFGAEYGGRISSVMDITTRDGNKKRLSGKISASTFEARTILEGPIKKSNDDNQGTSAFLLSVKNSYLKSTAPVFYNYIDTAGLPFTFLDLYGKISLNAANGSKLNIFGFNFRDKVSYGTLRDLNWSSGGIGSNFVLVPTGSQVLIKGNFAYSKYGVEMAEDAGKPRESNVDGFNFGINFTYFIRKSELNYGIEVLGFKTDFRYYNLNYKIEQQQSTSELAGYFRYKIVAGKLVLDPSFRAHYYASLTEISPEPRIGAKYNISDRFRIKGSAGRYSQNLLAANSDRDVVNLFYGFLSGPDNLPEKFTDQNGKERDVNSRLQKANHYILGFELDITNNLSLNLETYAKEFTQLSNLNRSKIFNDTPENDTKPEVLRKDFIIETGYARGVDLLVKYDYKKLYIWAVYSYGFVRRWDGIQLYPPHFDRRHNVNLVTAYTFGEGLNWEVNARWNFGSGFPFTQTQGYYEQLNFENNINSNITQLNGNLGILYGNLNGNRLPTFHRFDISAKRKIALSENTLLELNAGITNVYSRKNVFYFDRITNKTIYQFPIMPSLGVTLNF